MSKHPVPYAGREARDSSVSSRAQAMRDAAIIEDFWARRGRKVKAVAEPVGVDSCGKCVWGVRSDLSFSAAVFDAAQTRARYPEPSE